VVASTEALSRGWVKQEVDVVLDERSRSQDFRVIALRLADAKADELVRGLSWIDVPDGKLTPTVAASILCGFHPVERWPDPSTSRDVYVSASWQSSDNASALAVCRRLIATGFRLIGDSRTQRGFSGDRVASIMASCGAAVVVIPYRGSDRARSGEAPYKYFLQEHDQAQALQLPLLVVADPRVRREDGDDGSWLRMPTDAGTCPPEIDASIEALWGEWREPTSRHLAFYATDLTAEAARRGSDVRRVLELVTGMPTASGPTSRPLRSRRRSCGRWAKPSSLSPTSPATSATGSTSTSASRPAWLWRRVATWSSWRPATRAARRSCSEAAASSRPTATRSSSWAASGGSPGASAAA
jgi:hypothetical protein